MNQMGYPLAIVQLVDTNHGRRSFVVKIRRNLFDGIEPKVEIQQGELLSRESESL